MDVSGIVDEKSLEAWLNRLPQRTEAEKAKAQRWAVMIAHRAAMRVLPRYLSTDFAPYSEKVLGRKIPALMFGLLTMVTSNSDDADLSSNLLGAHFAFARLYRDWDEIFALFATGESLLSNLDTLEIASEAVWAADCGGSVFDQIYHFTREDSTRLLHGDDLFERPLAMPLQDFGCLDLWHETRGKLLAEGSDWQFWIDWYDNVLHGDPQDWLLLTKIALIDPLVWNKGADHVNALIKQIIEQHKLAAEAQRLKAENEQLVEQLRALEQRSHNNPPDGLVDDLPTPVALTEISWHLGDAARELEKSSPSRSLLVKIATALLNAAKAFAVYCGSLADTALTEGAKAFGKAGGTAFVACFAAQNEQVQAFARALFAFARSLGG